MEKINQTEEGHCPTLERSTTQQSATFKNRRDTENVYQANNTDTFR